MTEIQTSRLGIDIHLSPTKIRLIENKPKEFVDRYIFNKEVFETKYMKFGTYIHKMIETRLPENDAEQLVLENMDTLMGAEPKEREFELNETIKDWR